MAKVFGVHWFELRQGVHGGDFEKVFLEEYVPHMQKLGVKVYALRGDRGERTGKYAMIAEMESVEQRNRLFPAEGQMSEETSRLLGPNFQAISEKLDTLVTDWVWTDYVEQDK